MGGVDHEATWTWGVMERGERHVEVTLPLEVISGRGRIAKGWKRNCGSTTPSGGGRALVPAGDVSIERHLLLLGWGSNCQEKRIQRRRFHFREGIAILSRGFQSVSGGRSKETC